MSVRLSRPQILHQAMAQGDKFTLQEGLVFASGFHMRSLSKHLLQKLNGVILFTSFADEFDELALRRNQIFRLQAFSTDLSQTMFQ